MLQLAKDLTFPGVPILYSWASAYKLSCYRPDEETISLTIKPGSSLPEELTETSGVKEIHVIAYSMGNRATVGALDRLTGSAEYRTDAGAFAPALTAIAPHGS